MVALFGQPVENDLLLALGVVEREQGRGGRRELLALLREGRGHKGVEPRVWPSARAVQERFGLRQKGGRLPTGGGHRLQEITVPLVPCACQGVRPLRQAQGLRGEHWKPAFRRPCCAPSE